MRHQFWVAALTTAIWFRSVTADGTPADSSPLTPRRIRPIPRPGRVPENFTPDTAPPPPRLGGNRPRPAPGDDLSLPKRLIPGGNKDSPNIPSDSNRDPYVPPAVPKLSQTPSKVSNKGGKGEADGTYHPCSPKRYDENLCIEILGVGVDLLQELLPDPEETSTDVVTKTIQNSAIATRVSRAFNNFALETSVPSMPNLNMSEWMSGTKYAEVFTPQEFNLLRDDPLCFFAVYERIYRAYASLDIGSTVVSSSQASPTTSQGLSRRQIGCNNAPELCKEPADKARTLYLGYLPDQIHLVYKHTPTEVTVKESGTTSCQGFTLEDQVTIPAFATTYGVFEYKPGRSPTPTPTQTSTQPPPQNTQGMVDNGTGRSATLSLAGIGFAFVTTILGAVM